MTIHRAVQYDDLPEGAQSAYDESMMHSNMEIVRRSTIQHALRNAGVYLADESGHRDAGKIAAAQDLLVWMHDNDIQMIIL